MIMNVEIASRLVQMRKKEELSQEMLAERLGISRQAVSKWERAESSPDTSNLIMLAKLYNVSLDELLGVNQEKFEIVEDTSTENSSDLNDGKKEDRANYVSIGWKGIHVKDGEDEVHVGWKGIYVKEKGENRVQIGDVYNEDVYNEKEAWYDNIRFGVVGVDGYERYNWKVDGIFSLIILCIYLWIGFEYSLWHPSWLLFLLIPIVTSLIQAIKSKNASIFAYPVLMALSYLYFGFVGGIWHPTWIVFITIPAYYAVVDKLWKKK